MAKYFPYKDPQFSKELRVALRMFCFNARIIPGKVCREEFIEQVVADLISEPNAYECDGLFLNVLHCAFVGVAAVVINEICFGFKHRLAVVVNVCKIIVRKAKSDITRLEHDRNKKKSLACKGYILFREALEIILKKIGNWFK
jgi:hypothetical protein